MFYSACLQRKIASLMCSTLQIGILNTAPADVLYHHLLAEPAFEQ
jgi:hypothetical protein